MSTMAAETGLTFSDAEREAFTGQRYSLEEGVELGPFTTMGVGGPARYFARLTRETDLLALEQWASDRRMAILVLGGGSNLIVADSGFDGLVVKIEITGIQQILEDEHEVEVEVGAGVDWDEFVEHTVKRGWWGVENLSLIPGTCGAVPVQNVGAYGQEVRAVIRSVRAFDLRERRFVDLSNASCGFRYRKSMFNTTEIGRYVIVAVRFRLSKQPRPVLSRRDVAREVNRRLERFRGSEARGKRNQGIQGVIRDVIINLRSNGKLLPAPGSFGSAGTFFQTRVLAIDEFLPLLLHSLSRLDLRLASVLIACRLRLSKVSGFLVPPRPLIQLCKLSRISRNGVSLYATNCSVLVTSGKASSGDILDVIRIVREAVYVKTGIVLPVEPTLVGFERADLERAFHLPRCPSSGCARSDH